MEAYQSAILRDTVFSLECCGWLFIILICSNRIL